MISLRQVKFQIGEVLNDLSEAAFAALAWIEEDDGFQAASRRRVKLKISTGDANKAGSVEWDDSTRRWMA